MSSDAPNAGRFQRLLFAFAEEGVELFQERVVGGEFRHTASEKILAQREGVKG